jgi:hypothetical protein
MQIIIRATDSLIATVFSLIALAFLVGGGLALLGQFFGRKATPAVSTAPKTLAVTGIRS